MNLTLIWKTLRELLNRVLKERIVGISRMMVHLPSVLFHLAHVSQRPSEDRFNSFLRHPRVQ